MLIPGERPGVSRPTDGRAVFQHGDGANQIGTRLTNCSLHVDGLTPAARL